MIGKLIDFPTKQASDLPPSESKVTPGGAGRVAGGANGR